MAMKIKVAYVIEELSVGGAERVVVDLANGLDKGMFDVSVFCLVRAGELSNQLRSAGIRELGKRPGVDFKPAIMLWRILKNEKFDVVHTHLFTGALWGRLAAILAGVPAVITTEHSVDLWKDRKRLLVDRCLSIFTDATVTVSDHLKTFFVRTRMLPAAKVVTIYNGINLKEFSQKVTRGMRGKLGIPRGAKVVGTVGRLAQPKRHDRFLEAISLALQKEPRITAVLVGDGLLREELESHAKTLNIHDRVLFLGSRQDVPKLLSLLDVFVNSSDREGLPVSILEAMAAGKPVVATSIGGTPEIIEDGVTGFLVPSGDVTLLADRILRTLNGGLPMKNMLRAQRAMLQEEFTRDAMVRKTEELYGRVLKRKLRRKRTRNVMEDKRRFLASRVPVFLYHKLYSSGDRLEQGTDVADFYAVSHNEFRRQLAFLRGHGYCAVPLLAPSTHLSRRSTERAVALTFDDSDVSLYNLAFPTLKEFGFTATFFVTTSEVGRPGQVSWEHLRTMVCAGMTVASHTTSHRFLTGLSREELVEELQGSKRALESVLHRPISLLALPGGRSNRQVMGVAREVGYRGIATSEPGLHRAVGNVYVFRRFIITRNTGFGTFVRMCQQERATVTALKAWRCASNLSKMIMGDQLYRDIHTKATAARTP